MRAIWRTGCLQPTTTCRWPWSVPAQALATSPDAGPHFADYQKVDQLLDAAEQSVRQSFESAPELAVDRHLSAVATLIGNWTINSARDLAWTNCLLLWAVRDNRVARGLLL